jgi:hypothetical protein
MLIEHRATAKRALQVSPFIALLFTAGLIVSPVAVPPCR